MGDVKIKASEIAQFLKLPLNGDDVEIYQACSLNNIKTNSITFAKKYSKDYADKFNASVNLCILASSDYEGKLSSSHIISENPRLDFAKVLQQFLNKKLIHGIAGSAVIGENVSLGRNVSIGEYSIIGKNVTIGDNTEIRHHVVISDDTVIGCNCLIKSNTVIGEEGFGFERDKDGVPIRIPHLGKVLIGDNVEIGASAVIARGTLDNTFIMDNVKIDDQVFIAHNVQIGSNSMIIANSEISGSTKIGINCWLGPNSSVMNGVTIGDNVFIGLGSVITKSVESNSIIAGNPARNIDELKRINKFINQIGKSD
jgi:UDP-3-O-[3-hydroxymyristoyl] glucosamine N-acyltransferase